MSTNKVSVRGLIDENVNGDELLIDVYNKYFSAYLDKSILEKITILNKDYKKVDTILQQLVGVYDVPANNSGLHAEFHNMLWNFIDRIIFFNRNRAQVRDGYVPDSFDLQYMLPENETYYHMNTIIEFRAGSSPKFKDTAKNTLTAIYDTVYSTHNEDGTVQDKYGRKVKVLKYIINELNKIFGKLDHTKNDWYQYYEKTFNGNKQYKLVITNAIASFIGLSSYAPKINEEYEYRIWRSCQTFMDNSDDYARGIFPSLTDAGSIIAYITDGSFVNIYGSKSLNNAYKHPSMTARVIIRLLKRRDNKYFIALDRMYPDDRYGISVFDTINNIIKSKPELNVKLAIFDDYVSSQGSNDNEKIYDKYNKQYYIYHTAKSAHWITPYKINNDDCNSNESYNTHYDDQNRSYQMCNSNIIKGTEGSYKYKYNILTEGE